MALFGAPFGTDPLYGMPGWPMQPEVELARANRQAAEFNVLWAAQQAVREPVAPGIYWERTGGKTHRVTFVGDLRSEQTKIHRILALAGLTPGCHGWQKAMSLVERGWRPSQIVRAFNGSSHYVAQLEAQGL